MARFAGGLAVMMAVSCALTRSPFAEGQGTDRSDQAFVTKASESGIAEVELGKLGSAQAHDAEVKRFAERMVTDHRKANEELTALARKKGYTLAAGIGKDHREAALHVGKLQGEQFDRQFMAQMVKDHEAAVELFASEAQSGQDADLKEWAGKTLPTLREHLRMAKSLATNQR